MRGERRPFAFVRCRIGEGSDHAIHTLLARGRKVRRPMINRVAAGCGQLLYWVFLAPPLYLVERGLRAFGWEPTLEPEREDRGSRAPVLPEDRWIVETPIYEDESERRRGGWRRH